MKRFLCIILTLACILAFGSCGKSNEDVTPSTPQPEGTAAPSLSGTTAPEGTTSPEKTTPLEEVPPGEEPSDIVYALLPTDSYVISQTATNYVKLNVSYTANDGTQHNGDILVWLDEENAPITVANFQKLVAQGFYDGLIFHRVIENFMIQGGDPEGTGYGGSDETIKGEFLANGVNNTISHERGVISMARAGERYNSNGQLIDNGYDSANSQFFIMHRTYPSLDGLYAAFGYVIFGMQTVDGIAAVRTNYADKPCVNVVINSAVFISNIYTTE